MKNTRNLKLLVGGTALIAALGAQAAIITVQVGPIPYDTEPDPLTHGLFVPGAGTPYPDGTFYIDVPTFDGSLGALQSVDFDFNAGVRGPVGVENMSTVNQAFNVQLKLDGETYLTPAGLDSTVVANNLSVINGTALSGIEPLLDIFDGTPDQDGDSGFGEYLDTGLDNGSNSTSDPLALAAMTGNGVDTASWYLGALGAKGTVGTAADLDTVATSYGYGNLTVYYNYFVPDNEVPEASTSIALLGLLGTGALWYRRNRVAASK